MDKLFKFSIKQTVPVMLGYICMGIAYGLLLQQAGYNWVWAFFSSVLILGGSIQFVMLNMLTGGMGIPAVIALTLSINSRHIFYGISFIEKFKAMGKKFPYMIFALTDETYALLCGLRDSKDFNSRCKEMLIFENKSNETKSKAEEKIQEKVYFQISLLDHMWWVLGSVMGGVLGAFIKFDTTGVDFAMTALF
ncbi:MAG: AzlC family ABC transporter permease, partial [Anaerovoracaceae bacterium]